MRKNKNFQLVMEGGAVILNYITFPVLRKRGRWEKEVYNPFYPVHL